MIRSNAPVVIIVQADEPDVIEARLTPGTLWDKPASTGSQAVDPLFPSVEDSALRTMAWPKRFGSISLSQILLGMTFFMDVRSVGYFGLSDDGLERIEIAFDEVNLDDEGWRSKLWDGLRQGLQAEDVVLQFA